MALVVKRCVPTPESVVSLYRLEGCYLSGLRHFSVHSGKRNPTKNEWRGYVPSGAVQPIWKNDDEFDGLPVPLGLVDQCPTLLSRTSLFPENQPRSSASLEPGPEPKSSRRSEPYFALAFSSLESTSLIVAIPIGNRSIGGSRRVLKISELENLVSASAGTEPHSLLVDTLYVYPFPVRLRPDAKGADCTIATPGFVVRPPVLPEREREKFAERLQYFRDGGEDWIEPQLDLEKPLYSVFYDSDGVILYFSVKPSLGGDVVTPPEPIVSGAGIHWTKARELKFFDRITDNDERLSVGESGRPRSPDTLGDWLVDRTPAKNS